MATVTSLAPLPGGTPLTGAVGISSTSPAIVVGESSGTNSITLALGNIGGVKTLNTQNGDLNVIMSDGMGIVESTGGNLLLHPYSPLTGTATTATMVAGNLNNAMAWQGAGGPPAVSTVAYVPGAVVIYSGSTFVCLVAQPIGSAIPASGANWQSIGGGGGGSGTSISNGTAPNNSSIVCDTSGNILVTAAGSLGGTIIGGIMNVTSGYGYNVGDSGFNVYSQGTYPFGVQFGGGATVPSPNTGLYLNDTLLYFNNTNLLAPQTQIANGTTPNNGTVSIDPTGAITLTSAGNITTNCVDVILNASNNVAIEPTQFLLCQTTGTNPAQLKVGGPSSDTGLYVSNTDLTFDSYQLYAQNVRPIVAPYINNNLNWQGGGSPAVSTAAYVPGQMVRHSNGTFICLTAQPIGSSEPVDGSAWAKIGNYT